MLGRNRTAVAARDPGYVLDVSPAGSPAFDSHITDAARFVRFLAAAKAQRFIARPDSFEYPIDAGVAITFPEIPFSVLRLAPISTAQVGGGSQAPLLRQVDLL